VAAGSLQLEIRVFDFCNNHQLGYLKKSEKQSINSGYLKKSKNRQVS
jgi:hypothetical protein